jgi:type IV secretory pathway TraG/TraD family ATPase VirD4
MKPKRRQENPATDRLDMRQPLVDLSPVDSWRMADSVEGTIIVGSTGSGKTSGSGETIAKSLLSAGCGGLVLTAKIDERQLWERYCRETGRELIVFSPSSGRTFNFLEYELRRGGEGAGITENLVQLFCAVLEVAERRSGGGNGADYWQRAVRQLLRNAIDLALVSRGLLSVDLLHTIITSAPQSPEELSSPEWQESSTCMACIREGEAKAKTPEEAHDFGISASFFLKEFATLNPRTRSCIVSTFTTMSDLFLRGVIHRLLCTSTNLSIPEATHEGAVVILDLPVKEWNEVGQLVQVLVKFIWQRATERRDLAKYPRPCFLWADEAQLFVTEGDAMFQTTARSSRAATVYLTQSLSNVYAALGGGERGKALTHSLLGNLQTKIFHANGDSVTNHYAAELFAKSWQFRGSAGTSTSEGGYGERVSRNAGGSDSLEYEVLPQEFTMLRKGGVENEGRVEAIVFQGGRQWKATGKNFLRVTFRQIA